MELTRVRDLLTDRDLPLRDDEWASHRVLRNDGSLLVRLFGEHTQQQAIDILTENLPSVTVERFGDDSIVVRSSPLSDLVDQWRQQAATIEPDWPADEPWDNSGQEADAALALSLRECADALARRINYSQEG